VSTFPKDLLYTPEHEWVDDGEPAKVGITDTATEALGDIVYVELPAVGDLVRAGEVCGEIESTKSVSELFSPVNGEVIAINSAVVDDPALVNTDPYGEGWLIKVAVDAPAELLSPEEYEALATRA
jgi:glycine cleavage system H protein